jgi:predicted SnoaL-like aldol condensation-catalyzing enzyme
MDPAGRSDRSGGDCNSIEEIPMSHYTESELRNLALVRDFFESAIKRLDTDALARFVATDYIQHAPLAADGLAGLRAFLEGERAKHPPDSSHAVKFDIKRMFADGDHVIVHHHVYWEGFRGLAVMDIIRIEGDKLVEHWDVTQPIPEQSLNSNTMF